MNPLTELFAWTTDNELCDVVYVCLVEHFGFDTLTALEPQFNSRDVIAIFDVYAVYGAIFNGGLPRFLNNRGLQGRIAESYELIGASHIGKLLKSATRRMHQREQDGLPEVSRADEDEKFEAIEEEFVRCEKDIQDQLASFLRSGFRDPLFLGDEIQEALLKHGTKIE